MAPDGTVPDVPGPRSSRSRRTAAALASASFVVPCLFALYWASPDTRFSEDVALVRQFGLLPLGLEGLISTGFGALFDAIPLGSRVLRASWVAALGLGAFSWLLFRVTQTALVALRGEAVAGSSLRDTLALSAALAATLSPPFVLEGSIPGGYGVAAALTLAVVAVVSGVFEVGPKTPLYLGALVGASLLESRWAGVACAGALVAAVAKRRELCTQQAATTFVLTLGALALLPLSLAVAFWTFPTGGPQLSLALFPGVSWKLVPAPESAAFVAWASIAGLLWCAVSLGGLGLGLVHPRARRIALPLALFILLDALFSAADRGPSHRDPLGAVRLLALGALAASAALAVRAGMLALERHRVPFGRAVSTLIMVYGFTLALVSAESSATASADRSQSVTDVYSEQTLETLQPASVVLVRSEPMLLRLAAARLTRGSRPDVLIVPMQLLESGSGRARALSREPGLMPLVRDVLLTGRPGEYALSALSDVRPLYLQPDPDWETRLHTHLVPRPFFTGFSPHPLGRSDRRVGLDEGEASLARVLAALAHEPTGDPAVREAVAHDLGQRALLLSSLGDRDAVRQLVEQLLAVDPESELARELKRRSARAGQGPLAVF